MNPNIRTKFLKIQSANISKINKFASDSEDLITDVDSYLGENRLDWMKKDIIPIWEEINTLKEKVLAFSRAGFHFKGDKEEMKEAVLLMRATANDLKNKFDELFKKLFSAKKNVIEEKPLEVVSKGENNVNKLNSESSEPLETFHVGHEMFSTLKAKYFPSYTVVDSIVEKNHDDAVAKLMVFHDQYGGIEKYKNQFANKFFKLLPKAISHGIVSRISKYTKNPEDYFITVSCSIPETDLEGIEGDEKEPMPYIIMPARKDIQGNIIFEIMCIISKKDKKIKPYRLSKLEAK